LKQALESSLAAGFENFKTKIEAHEKSSSERSQNLGQTLNVNYFILQKHKHSLLSLF